MKQAARAPRPLDAVNERLASAAMRVSTLTGARRLLAAFLSGAGAALAFAPLYLLPLLAVGLSVFVLLIDGAARRPKPRRAAFAAGWFFGFGYFLVSLYWLGFSFLVQAEQFAWMAPFAVTGLPAFLGLFTGSAAAVAVSIWRQGPRRVLTFSGVYMTFEYARGHVLTGLPWNLPGQALAGTAVGAQTAAWWGVYGLSLIVVMLAAAPALARDRAGVQGLLAMLLGTGVLYVLGAFRLAGPDPGFREDVSIRIVQPNIPQREKIDGDLWTRNLKLHLDLSTGEAAGAARLYILWPENAAPYLQEYGEALDLLDRAVPANAMVLAGTVRRETGPGGEKYYNSIGFFAARGGRLSAVGYYDKHHLAPFGEYLPLQGALRAIGLAQLAPYEDGFAFGKGPMTFDDGATRFAPFICYETIFPGALYPRHQRPDWLATATNDAWFGDSSGPRQHLDQARLRAIETGLPMARSANTGVSALFDARGRLLQSVPLYKAGRIDAALPGALPPTIYARYGDLLFLMLAIGAFVLAALPSKRARTTN
jgi:apolipoprotein N-acyltransferase